MAGAAQGHGLRTFLMLDWHSPQTSSDWRVRPEISAGLGRRGGAHWERARARARMKKQAEGQLWRHLAQATGSGVGPGSWGFQQGQEG